MSLDMITRYEFEKELGIQKALVADLEGKLSHVNVELDTVKLDKTGYIEQLTVNESVYKANLKKLYTEITAGNRRGVEALKIMKADEIKYNTLQEKYDLDISDLNDRISKQDTVIGDLTEDLQRANRDNGVLQVKLEKVERNRVTLDKLDKVLETFE